MGSDRADLKLFNKRQRRNTYGEGNHRKDTRDVGFKHIGLILRVDYVDCEDSKPTSKQCPGHKTLPLNAVNIIFIDANVCL